MARHGLVFNASHEHLNAPFELEAETKAIKAYRDAGAQPFSAFPNPLKRCPISGTVRRCRAGVSPLITGQPVGLRSTPISRPLRANAAQALLGGGGPGDVT
jgi:hypothetical protein